MPHAPFQRMLLYGLNRAKCIASVLKTTRNALLAVSKVSSEHVVTIFIGPNHPYCPMPREEAQERVSRLLGANAVNP
jgi:hypothetical protein